MAINRDAITLDQEQQALSDAMDAQGYMLQADLEQQKKYYKNIAKNSPKVSEVATIDFHVLEKKAKLESKDFSYISAKLYQMYFEGKVPAIV